MEKLSKIIKGSARTELNVAFYDIFFAVISLMISVFLKFGKLEYIPTEIANNLALFLVVDVALMIGIFAKFKIYKSMWEYPVFSSFESLFIAFILPKEMMLLLFFKIWSHDFVIWFFIYKIIDGLFVFGTRLYIRSSANTSRRRQNASIILEKSRVLIVGAGMAGNMVIKELSDNECFEKIRVFALIDDDSKKHGKYLNNILIVGGREKIVETVRKYQIDEIYIAIPSASARETKKIIDICQQTDCKIKKLPGMYQIISGKLIATQLKEIDLYDLLGRDPIKVELDDAYDALRGKVVMVTGGGGSIGSEICRQIACSGMAKTLIIFDSYENSAYRIQQEILNYYPNQDLKVLIGSVRDESRLDEVFKKYRPDYVYHAAAHKHVPLMENSPREAIKNNVIGTWNLVNVADKYEVRRFVMISTDKAVKSTNVMGATKRVCEIIVQQYNKISKTEFVSVRFGNVLGSNGSVIPLFKEQIERGGPVTVTHRDMVRYFMLIPEAVSLVLAAGVKAKGGEIFVLNMGTPIKIYDLAEKMIKLSGFTPGVDIDIEITGLREGEKLYEEVFLDEEGVSRTMDDMIYVAKPLKINTNKFFIYINELKDKIDIYDESDLIVKLKQLAPSYTYTGNKVILFPNKEDGLKDSAKINMVSSDNVAFV